MPSTLQRAAALQDFLTRITDPASVHRLHNCLLFKALSEGEFTASEMADLHALNDLLVNCHHLYDIQFRPGLLPPSPNCSPRIKD